MTSSSESDKVLGLESGADDYLTKPFASVASEMANVTGSPTTGYNATFTVGITT